MQKQVAAPQCRKPERDWVEPDSCFYRKPFQKLNQGLMRNTSISFRQGRTLGHLKNLSLGLTSKKFSIVISETTTLGLSFPIHKPLGNHSRNLLAHVTETLKSMRHGLLKSSHYVTKIQFLLLVLSVVCFILSRLR